MTKQVRIENADTSSYPVRVTVQQAEYVDGKPTGNWIDASTKQIDFPTAMLQEYVHSGQRLIIEERAAG